LLPGDRALSFVETALFCTVTHFPFRQATGLAIDGYARLGAFCERFGQRDAAKQTEYRFDFGK
jgi:hypothetical protein